MPRRFLATFPTEKPLLRRGKPAAFEPDVFSRTNFHAKMKDSQKAVLFLGGDKRDRTADLLNAIQALSQLSYTPIFACSRCQLDYYNRKTTACQPQKSQKEKIFSTDALRPVSPRLHIKKRTASRLSSLHFRVEPPRPHRPASLRRAAGCGVFSAARSQGASTA